MIELSRGGIIPLELNRSGGLRGTLADKPDILYARIPAILNKDHRTTGRAVPFYKPPFRVFVTYAPSGADEPD
jgi:hypothetical protein